MPEPASPEREFLVVCLCADWCGTCRDYRAPFEALGKELPDAEFLWVDIEDEGDWAGDFEVDDFPTLLIQRREWILFYGTMLPHVGHLQRTLEMFRSQSPEESRGYAFASPERRGWQEKFDFRAARKQQTGR